MITRAASAFTPAQREIAGLDKDVVFVGDEDHFEIWDAKRWDDFVGSVDLASLMSESSELAL